MGVEVDEKARLNSLVVHNTVALCLDAWNDGADKHVVEARFTLSLYGPRVLLEALTANRVCMSSATVKQLAAVVNGNQWPKGERNRTVRFIVRDETDFEDLITRLISPIGVIERIGVIHEAE